MAIILVNLDFTVGPDTNDVSSDVFHVKITTIKSNRSSKDLRYILCRQIGQNMIGKHAFFVKCKHGIHSDEFLDLIRNLCLSVVICKWQYYSVLYPFLPAGSSSPLQLTDTSQRVETIKIYYFDRTKGVLWHKTENQLHPSLLCWPYGVSGPLDKMFHLDVVLEYPTERGQLGVYLHANKVLLLKPSKCFCPSFLVEQGNRLS